MGRENRDVARPGRLQDDPSHGVVVRRRLAASTVGLGSFMWQGVHERRSSAQPFRGQKNGFLALRSVRSPVS